MKFTVKRANELVRDGRITQLELAVSFARERADDWSQVWRLTQALRDVTCNTVLDRTEAALVEARRLVGERTR